MAATVRQAHLPNVITTHDTDRGFPTLIQPGHTPDEGAPQLAVCPGWDFSQGNLPLVTDIRTIEGAEDTQRLEIDYGPAAKFVSKELARTDQAVLDHLELIVVERLRTGSSGRRIIDHVYPIGVYNRQPCYLEILLQHAAKRPTSANVRKAEPMEPPKLLQPQPYSSYVVDQGAGKVIGLMARPIEFTAIYDANGVRIATGRRVG